MTEPTKSPFETLAAINVNAHVEKKNGLSYLSWSWALDQLLRADPQARWEYQEPRMFGQTMMVFCSVTAFGITRSCQLPVMDHRNKCITNPDAFAVNTAMQRCLVKAIAMHGLGLYIYAGEDLPLEEQEAQQEEKAKPKPVKTLPIDACSDAWAKCGEEEQAFLQGIADEAIAVYVEEGPAAAWAMLASKNLDSEEKAALWTRFTPDQQKEMRKVSKAKAA